MSILDEIREQPEHIRKIMFGFCVITTVSIVGVIWYRSLERNLFALLNPDEIANQPKYAQTNSGLFGDIGSTFSDLGGTISNFVGFGDKAKNAKIGTEPGVATKESGKAYLLPLSGMK